MKLRILFYLLTCLTCAGQWGLRSPGWMPQTIASSVTPNYVTNGLSAYWPCDATNSVGSDSVGTNQWIPNGGITTGGGLIGNSLICVSNLLQYVSIADGPDVSTANKSWALVFWFKRYTTNILVNVCGKYGGVGAKEWLFSEYQNVYFYGTSNATAMTSVTSTAKPTTNTWHLGALMFDTTNRDMVLRIDAGAPQTNQLAGVNTTATATPVNFGRGGTGGTAYFDGELDEICMWTNRTLSVTELTQIYNFNLGGTNISNIPMP